MSEDLSNWTPRPHPERITFEGRYVRLEPISQKHEEDLFIASTVSDISSRFRYLTIEPTYDKDTFHKWILENEKSSDPLFYAVIDKESGKAAGRQSFLRIDQNFGVVEIGHIYWGPLISRKRGATEAQYLLMEYAFDVLGYRRYEWKCDNQNEPSKNAALRFGFKFEGVFRQHMIIKGYSRDTAWFAIIDKDWPKLKVAYQKWLNPENFDKKTGEQKQKLQYFINKN